MQWVHNDISWITVDRKTILGLSWIIWDTVYKPHSCLSRDIWFSAPDLPSPKDKGSWIKWLVGLGMDMGPSLTLPSKKGSSNQGCVRVKNTHHQGFHGAIGIALWWIFRVNQYQTWMKNTWRSVYARSSTIQRVPLYRIVPATLSNGLKTRRKSI